MEPKGAASRAATGRTGPLALGSASLPSRPGRPAAPGPGASSGPPRFDLWTPAVVSTGLGHLGAGGDWKEDRRKCARER